MKQAMTITLAVGQSTDVNGVQVKFLKYSSGMSDSAQSGASSTASLFTTYEFELSDSSSHGAVTKEYVIDAYAGVATHTKFEYNNQNFEFAGFDQQSKKISLKTQTK